jgi:hypothetical protein
MGEREVSGFPARGVLRWNGQGLEEGRAAGGMEIEERGAEALPEMSASGLDDDDAAAAGEEHARGGLEQQDAEALAA